jgi:hypothetical protein
MFHNNGLATSFINDLLCHAAFMTLEIEKEKREERRENSLFSPFSLLLFISLGSLALFELPPQG